MGNKGFSLLEQALWITLISFILISLADLKVNLIKKEYTSFKEFQKKTRNR